MRNIKNVEFKNRVFLAPMAGVTNMAFRKLAVKHGAGMVYAEMVSDKGLLYDNVRTKRMIEVSDDEHPVVMQIFGSNKETLVLAAKYIEEHSKADIIDINMGCPVNKVIKSGAGSALLKDPDKVYEIVKAVKEAVKLPVTIKIRAGWDHSSINCVEVVKAATRAGVDAIAIHGRTRSMMYRGESSLEFIKMVRDATDVFVIGNGDVKSKEDVQKMLDLGVDAVMIGRASLGNPWIFKSITENTEYVPTNKEKLDAILEHLELMIKEKGEYVAIREMRKHISGYTKNLPNSSKFREEMNKIENKDELINYITEYLSF
jgi:nifR3 family TIM-barrel protein